MKLLIATFWFVGLSVTLVPARHSNVIHLDENSICHIKKSCLDCLRLPQCSWCSGENKCYSEHLMTSKGYCENATVRHVDYGMSLIENAECSCVTGNMERHCIPPGVPQEKECSDRGQCVCGRCFCDLLPQHPTKVVMGEYCEYDNFSCDGPRCNEGPYNINELKLNDDDIQTASETETEISQPLEE